MKMLSTLFLILGVLHCSYAPPVKEGENKSKEEDSEIREDLADYMEYHRYLKEVVQALESDAVFREQLEKADEDDVRSGKIAEHLDFVNHNVRTKLDEIKRRELERLRHLATKQFELTNDLDTDAGKVPSNDHLDHGNPHTFEIEDLKKLIKKTTADLEVADKKRKDEFKEYEMKKKFEEEQKVKEMDEQHKKEYLEKQKAEEEAKKHHKPIHHPGSKQQLEEVWEKQDHMDSQQFDPKVFFMMHDVDGNGVWDADEVKALFIKELDKIYGPGGPNKDKHERAEEMERMREHVFQENDRNRDGLIDYNEFLHETQRADFNQDPGWKTVDENEVYSQDEYDRFQRQQLEEITYLQQRGLIDAHGNAAPGAEHQIHRAIQEYRAQRHHGAYPQQGYVPQGQPPMNQGHPAYQGQPPVNQGHPAYQGQPPVNQGYPAQQGYPGQPAGNQVYQGHPAVNQGQQQFQQPPQYQQQAYQQQQPAYQPPQQQAYQQPPVQNQAQQNTQAQPKAQNLTPQNQGQQPIANQVPESQPPQSQAQGQAPPVQGQNQPVNVAHN